MKANCWVPASSRPTLDPVQEQSVRHCNSPTMCPGMLHLPQCTNHLRYRCRGCSSGQCTSALGTATVLCKRIPAWFPVALATRRVLAQASPQVPRKSPGESAQAASLRCHLNCRPLLRKPRDSSRLGAPSLCSGLACWQYFCSMHIQKDTGRCRYFSSSARNQSRKPPSKPSQ